MAAAPDAHMETLLAHVTGATHRALHAEIELLAPARRRELEELAEDILEDRRQLALRSVGAA